MRHWFANLTVARRLVLSALVHLFAILCLWQLMRKTTRVVQTGSLEVTETSHYFLRDLPLFWPIFALGVVLFWSWLWLWGSPEKTGDQA